MNGDYIAGCLKKYYKTALSSMDRDAKIQLLRYIVKVWHPDRSQHLEHADLTYVHTGLTQWANATLDDINNTPQNAAAASGADAT